MADVKVLLEGYAKQTDGGWTANSTVTLVVSNNKRLIVDPGCNRQALLDALKKEGLGTDRIDYVLLTHSHADHSLLAGIFEKARVLTTEELYEGDQQVAHNNKVPDTELAIIATPGHCAEHCSLIVPAKDGVYAVAGDVFWWTDDEQQKVDVNKEDQAHPAELDMKKLVDSRKKLLEIANCIIPGHGKMFKVEK